MTKLLNLGQPVTDDDKTRWSWLMLAVRRIENWVRGFVAADLSFEPKSTAPASIAMAKNVQAAIEGVAAALAANGWNLLMKPGAEGRVSTTTLAADSVLTFPMEANKSYVFRAKIFYSSGATPGFKWRHAGPASPTFLAIEHRQIVPGAAAHSAIAVDTAYSAADINGSGTSSSGFIEMDGVIRNGVNAGNFSFQWAQNVSDVGATIVLAGSYLEWRKL